MKKPNILIFVWLILAGFAYQSSAQQTTPVKIAVIDSSAFENETTGLVKYVNAYKQIKNEIQPRENELKAMVARVQTLEKEVVQLQDAYQKNPSGPVRPEQIRAKADEIEQIKRQGAYKEEDLTKYIQTRKQQLVAPIVKDISVALQAYIKQKGYTVIFDVQKDQVGFLVVFDEKIDVTKDFIAFYNSRSAPVVVNSAPK